MFFIVADSIWIMKIDVTVELRDQIFQNKAFERTVNLMELRSDCRHSPVIQVATDMPIMCSMSYILCVNT